LTWIAATIINRKSSIINSEARDKKAIELFGEFAWLNFPPEAT
jgi:hypothetical protein